MATKNNSYRQMNEFSMYHWQPSAMDGGRAPPNIVDELKKLLHRPGDAKISHFFARRAYEVDYAEDAIEEFRRNGVDRDLYDGVAAMPTYRRHAYAYTDHMAANVSAPGMITGQQRQEKEGDARWQFQFPPPKLPASSSALTDWAKIWAALDSDWQPRKPRPHANDVCCTPRISAGAAAAVSPGHIDKDHRSTKRSKGGFCVFCRNNGEDRATYESHVVKDRHGKVTCPALRRYSCPICLTDGDDAHTIRYCPLKKHRDEATLAELTRPLDDFNGSSPSKPSKK